MHSVNIPIQVCEIWDVQMFCNAATEYFIEKKRSLIYDNHIIMY